MPRLGYRKSRRGCLRCKQRRVKCDEGRPCSACARHGLECTYAAERNASSSEHAARSPSLTPSDSASIVTAPKTATTAPKTTAAAHELSPPFRNAMAPATAASTPSDPGWSNPSLTLPSDPFPYFDKFVTGPGSIDQSPWLTDLELMHHYTSSTYMTLPRASYLHQVWQIEIPKLAMSHAFLLHQILAVAAHHQSHLHPERYSHYSICASLHQNRTIAGLRTALANISEDTCHELFVASSMLSICAFAAFSNYGGVDEQPRIDDFLDVAQLVRGMSKILDAYDDLLARGRLGKLFLTEDTNQPAMPLLSAIVEQLRQLEIPDMIHPATACVCRESIAGIMTWVENAVLSTAAPDLRVCVSFPICLTEEFIDLVRQRHPVALLIISHYCVILHYTGLEHWYLRGWGRSILDDIATNIDPRWHKQLEWPMGIVENGAM
ncbi:hypothetical protein AK830_g12118 [Neonectria ditissima]|uniref:Zn(2)-C6 fungal-type domain-containing protein n=1 Tax=Neonectria ditissima TaxID=78410 RepID=A0A0P7AZS4_9HYPO|nr:hypothetical protein AK830_g12118 [Neonectria ditissima]